MIESFIYEGDIVALQRYCGFGWTGEKANALGPIDDNGDHYCDEELGHVATRLYHKCRCGETFPFAEE